MSKKYTIVLFDEQHELSRAKKLCNLINDFMEKTYRANRIVNLSELNKLYWAIATLKGAVKCDSLELEVDDTSFYNATVCIKGSSIEIMNPKLFAEIAAQSNSVLSIYIGVNNTVRTTFSFTLSRSELKSLKEVS